MLEWGVGMTCSEERSYLERKGRKGGRREREMRGWRRKSQARAEEEGTAEMKGGRRRKAKLDA